MVDYFIDLCMLNHSYIATVKPTSLLMSSWVILKYFYEYFSSMFIKEIDLQFSLWCLYVI